MLRPDAANPQWLPQMNASGVGTSAGPAIQGWNDGVYAVWKGEGDSTQLWWGQMVSAELGQIQES